MSLQVHIQVEGTAREALNYLRRSLGDLTGINRQVAAAEERFFRDYIRRYAQGKHATAKRLGATPTGFYERAAESPEGTASAFGVVVTMGPGEAFARAFRDVEITPRAGKKWLTIPAVAAAYGRRAGSIDNLKFVPLGNDLAALMKRAQAGAEWTVFYWLKKRVLQKQQRELLPSDEGIAEVAGEAIEDALVRTLAGENLS